MRSAQDLRRRKIDAQRILYGELGQFVRLEWETETGGTWRPSYKVYEGTTITDHVEDNVRCLKRSLGLNELKLVQDARLSVGDAVWSLLPTKNFSLKKKLTIVHKLMDQKVSGSGSGASDVFTVTGASYTVNDYAGWWLFFSDRRFQVESNTADAFTVNLKGGTIPATGSFEVMPASEWYPMIQNPDPGDMFTYGHGDGVILFDVFCKPEPYAGGENKIDG